jgi:hypothetical protein
MEGIGDTIQKKKKKASPDLPTFIYATDVEKGNEKHCPLLRRRGVRDAAQGMAQLQIYHEQHAE